MKLLEIKKHLKTVKEIAFELPNGSLLPKHFHVTEIGEVTKHFIDCGGVVRNEKTVNFQLWEANDYNHRLAPDKLLKIIELSQNVLGIGNLTIEVEYQGDTIGKYGLAFKGSNFLLTTKQTDCLAKDNCGVPEDKKLVDLASLTKEDVCSPGGRCC